MRDRGSRVEKLPAVGKAVRRHVDDAHHERPARKLERARAKLPIDASVSALHHQGRIAIAILASTLRVGATMSVWPRIATSLVPATRLTTALPSCRRSAAPAAGLPAAASGDGLAGFGDDVGRRGDGNSFGRNRDHLDRHDRLPASIEPIHLGANLVFRNARIIEGVLDDAFPRIPYQSGREMLSALGVLTTLYGVLSSISFTTASVSRSPRSRR